jgi:hypothetical protein
MGMELHFGGDKKGLELEGMVAQPCECAKNQ